MNESLRRMVLAVVGFIFLALIAAATSYAAATCMTDMPEARTDPRAVIDDDGLIYVIGGASRLDSSLKAEAQKTMYRYDAATDTWTRLPDMSQVRESFAAVYFDGYIYVIGGNYLSGPPITQYLDSAERFNIAANTWEDLPALPGKRGSVPVAAVGKDGKIYLFGGGSGSGNTQSSTLVLDPDSLPSGWSSVADMNVTRRQFTGCSVPGGDIYAVGGFQNNTTMLNSVETYHTDTNIWTCLTNPMSQENVGGAAVCSGSGDVYVIGGASADPGDPDYRRHVEKYDPASGMWETMAELNLQRVYPSAVMKDNHIYIFGGYNQQGLSQATVERYDINDPETGWTLSSDICMTPPVVSAGPDQQVHAGETVQLNGYVIDADEDSLPLTFQWTVLEEPGCGVSLSDPAALTPSLYIGCEGDYEFSLTATNTFGMASDPDTVTLSSVNSAPIADAGNSETYALGMTVLLDASASYDPDGDDITYAWTMISRPDQSSTELNDADQAQASFIPDVPGLYEIQLIVTDLWGAVSDPSLVEISTENSAPVAMAGDDQSADLIGQIVQLEGIGQDPNGDNLTYAWSFLSKPPESQTVFSDNSISNPVFVVDANGDFEIQLRVTDVWGLSGTDTLKVTFENVRPIADAGENQSVVVGDTVYLNGSQSSDANADALSYEWSLVSYPQGSGSGLAATDTAMTEFFVDVPGVYSVNLVVSDGMSASDPANVMITAVANIDYLNQLLMDAVEAINNLDKDQLKNVFGGYLGWRVRREFLTCKINMALILIAKEKYDAAAKLLNYFVVPHMDGCSESSELEMDDWVRDCSAQAGIYPLVMEAVEILEFFGQL